MLKKKILKKNNTIFQGVSIMVMVFSATFYNISVISWRPVALLEETRVPGENNQPNAKN